MKKWLSLTIICLTTGNFFAQSARFVDGINGNDLNNGTSLLTAWKTIQKACNSAVANSTVMIKGGTYHENIVVNVSGTAGQPITFIAYADEEVLIDGTSTAGNTLLSMTNKNYLRFENLTIQNKTVNEAQGILVETTGAGTSTGLAFSNITVRNINWTANATTIPTDTDNAQAFIVYGRNGGVSNLTISNCEVADNILGFSEAISLDGNISDFLISDCLVHDNTNIGIGLIGNYGTSTDPATDHTRNGTVSSNTCYRNVSLYATSGGIYVDGGVNILVERNKCYENGNGIEIGCEENGQAENIVVVNNLMYNNENVGLYIGGYTTETTGQVLNCKIRNNTLFRNNTANDETGEIAISKASNCVFENNIVYTSEQKVFMSVDNIAPQTGNTFNYNLLCTPSGDPDDIAVFWGNTTYETFAAYQTGTAQETNSIFANPAFTTTTLPDPNLAPLAAGPGRNAGNPQTLTSIGEMDYAGNSRVFETTIDIGAYEWTGTAGLEDINSGQQEAQVTQNPFTGDARIAVGTTLDHAVLKIYDLHGNVVRQMNDLHGTGFEINNINWPAGIYLYRISQADQNLFQGKLLIK